MAFNIPGVPFKLTAQDMGGLGGFNLADAISRGLDANKRFQEARVLPKQLAEELLAKQLSNKIQGVNAQYAEPMAQAGLRYKEALMQKALRPERPAMSNLEKAIAGAQRIKEQYGADSMEAKAADSYVQRLAQGSQGLQLTTDPTTGALTSLSFGGSRGAPQTGMSVDENGNPIMISRPTTPQATAQQKASLSEIARGKIAEKAEMPYLGTGSNEQILADRIKYTATKDKEAADRLVKAAVAKMIAPEYAAFQLSSQGVPATIPALKHQFETIQQGWPIASYLVVQNLPAELQKQAKKEHAKLLEEIKRAKEQHAAKGYPIKLDRINEVSDYAQPKGGMVGMYKNGKFHLIPAAEAKHAHEKWGYEYEK